MIRLVMNRLGVNWQTQGNDIIVPAEQTLTVEPDLGNAIPEISVMPWPAFPTDLMSIAIVIATQSKGSIFVPRLDVSFPNVLHRQISRHGCSDCAV